MRATQSTTTNWLAPCGTKRLNISTRRLAELKKTGSCEGVTSVTKEGFAADEIISLGQKTPDNLVSMCSHGRSGVRRWMLGSIAETVVRHSGDPILISRPE